ncbi:MAG: exosortase/archaeosortase family protein [Armatimonadetes bacterium]|nr:exosortase/archaeosortase family protein [Armatimonadota bacterium]
MESPSNQTNRTVLILWAVLCAVLLVALYRHVWPAFWYRWANEAAYSHCPLVPLAVAGLIWFHRRELAVLTPSPSARGLWLLGAGLVVCFLGYVTGARFIVGLSFPVVLMGLVATGLGSAYLRVLGFSLALFLFAIPFPRHILGMVAMPMQVISTILTVAATRLFGIPVLREGVNVALPSFQFVVAEACSGMNSLVALFLAGGVVAELMRLATWQKLVIYALTPVIVIAANVIRLLSVVVVGELVGPELALGQFVHGGSDVVVYLAAFALVWGLGNALQSWKPAGPGAVRDGSESLPEAHSGTGLEPP